jgi:hypothetical protein
MTLRDAAQAPRFASRKNAANKFCDKNADPSAAVPNEAATARAKTGKGVSGLLRWPTLKIMRSYAVVTEGRYAERDGCRSGGDYTKDKQANDFAAMRLKAFGKDEARTLADFRRSGAIEAIAGGVTPAALSHRIGQQPVASNAPAPANSLK